MFGNSCTPVADSCQSMAKPIQYCKVYSSSITFFLASKIYSCFSHLVKVRDTQLCPTFCNPKDYIHFMEFSRPEYWSGYPFPSPGDLSNSGIKPRFPALQVDS